MMRPPEAWLLHHSTLLAGEGRFFHMGSRFREGGSSVDAWDVLFLLAVTAAAVAAVWGLSRYLAMHEKHGYNGPYALFRELCRAHALNWSSTRLLSRLARAHKMSSPAELFLTPHRFAPEKLPEALASHAEEIQQLREKLFGSLRATGSRRPPEGHSGSAEARPADGAMLD